MLAERGEIDTCGVGGALCRAGCLSTNEVDDDEMKDSVSEQEVSEGSLRGDGQEVSFVLWVDLDA